MVKCKICEQPINFRKQFITCNGPCETSFHIACAGVDPDLPAVIEKNSGLSWRCLDCRASSVFFNQARIDDLLSDLNLKFESFKTEFLKLAEENLSNAAKNFTSPGPLFSDTVRRHNNPAIIIQPKNQQINSQTKSDIFQNIDPLERQIQIGRIKNVKNGGVLIAGNSTVDNEKLKKLAVDKLSNAYEVKEVKPLNPRIRVVGMSEKWELEHLTSYLIQINKHLFSIKPECKIINFGPTKKNDKIFQALVQVDQDSYSKIIDAGRLIVGYDSCNVYDAIEVRRCFNCNEFQHIATNCKNQLTCPKCGFGHDLKNCKSTFKRCVNCLLLNKKDKTNFDVNHSVWDVRDCQAYQRLLNKIKSEILGIK
jgi:hypothetical protein